MKNQMPNIPIINPMELHMIPKENKDIKYGLCYDSPLHINCRCISIPVEIQKAMAEEIIKHAYESSALYNILR